MRVKAVTYKRISRVESKVKDVFLRIDREEEQRRAIFRMLPDEVIEMIIERYTAKWTH